MTQNLTPHDLRLLVQRVFRPTGQDRGLAIIADVPDDRRSDHPAWAQRRALAAQWHEALLQEQGALGLAPLSLVWYGNAGRDNADLPPACALGAGGAVPAHVRDLAGLAPTTFAAVLAAHSLVLAPTEFSATAPLKVAARAAGPGPAGFRAATMPGFLPAMIPALRLDYELVNRRVDILKGWLDEAVRARCVFGTPGGPHELVLDLRHRCGHASGGLLPANGVAGNLPSGEAYIVPYEGELPGQPSGSQGTLPVQIGPEVVIYEIRGNKAVGVLSAGPESDREAALIAAEPAYANLAELGLGVLGDFGLEPTGSILLDEKLGLHIAFGRSDHFGGSVGPGDFSGPDAVIHLDRVYIPQTQPLVAVELVELTGPGGTRPVIEKGRFTGLDRTTG